MNEFEKLYEFLPPYIIYGGIFYFFKMDKTYKEYLISYDDNDDPLLFCSSPDLFECMNIMIDSLHKQRMVQHMPKGYKQRYDERYKQ